LRESLNWPFYQLEGPWHELLAGPAGGYTTRCWLARVRKPPSKGRSSTVAADELFPPSPRCVFKRAPLVQVVCQLRFPPLLAIESSVPAEFQERIRAAFPILERTSPTALTQMPAEILQILGAQTGALHYSFRTEDRTNTLSLAPDSISLTTTNYTRWDDFRPLLQGPLRALIKIYKPSFFARIGLRYSNANHAAEAEP